MLTLISDFLTYEMCSRRAFELPTEPKYSRRAIEGYRGASRDSRSSNSQQKTGAGPEMEFAIKRWSRANYYQYIIANSTARQQTVSASEVAKGACTFRRPKARPNPFWSASRLARWPARGCWAAPFLSHPHQERRKTMLTKGVNKQYHTQKAKHKNVVDV